MWWNERKMRVGIKLQGVEWEKVVGISVFLNLATILKLIRSRMFIRHKHLLKSYIFKILLKSSHIKKSSTIKALADIPGWFGFRASSQREDCCLKGKLLSLIFLLLIFEDVAAFDISIEIKLFGDFDEETLPLGTVWVITAGRWTIGICWVPTLETKPDLLWTQSWIILEILWDCRGNCSKDDLIALLLSFHTCSANKLILSN